MPDAVLVTGGTGLAGRHVIAALEQRGIQTIRIARTAAPGWHVADLTDPASIERLPQYTAVVHCAGLTPRRPDLDWDAFRRANVEATRHLAEAAIRIGAKRFVLVSTLGRSARARQSPVGRLYVVSKHLAERALRQTAAGKMEVWIVRAASMYGEGDRGSMARLIRAIARNRFLLPGNGAQRKCLCYAGALGDAIADGFATPAWQSFHRENAYDLQAPRMRDLVRIIERATGGHALRVPAPDAVIALGTAVIGRVPLPAARRAALGLTIALRDVPCEGPNLIGRAATPIALADAIGREVEWLRGTGSI